MIELTGSEKQIKWATDIRNEFFSNMQTLLSQLETRKNELQASGNIGGYENHVVIINSLKLYAEKATQIANAGVWIDQREKLMDLFKHAGAQNVMTYDESMSQIFMPAFRFNIAAAFYRIGREKLYAPTETAQTENESENNSGELALKLAELNKQLETAKNWVKKNSIKSEIAKIETAIAAGGAK